MSVFSSVKKAAAVVSNYAVSSHKELGMAIIQTKDYEEAVTRMVLSKAEATDASLKWASQENSPAMKELHEVLSLLDGMSKKIHQDYVEKYHSGRNCFKEIMKGEQALDEVRKQGQTYKAKVGKLSKQAGSAKGKNAAGVQQELTKAIDLEVKFNYDLEMQEKDHAKFKFNVVREYMRKVTEATTVLYQKNLSITDVQQQVVDLFLGETPSQGCVEGDVLNWAQQKSMKLVIDLAELLDVHMDAIDKNFKRMSFVSHIDETVDPMEAPTGIYDPIPEWDLSDGDVEKRSLPPVPSYNPGSSSNSQADVGGVYQYMDPNNMYLDMTRASQIAELPEPFPDLGPPPYTQHPPAPNHPPPSPPLPPPPQDWQGVTPVPEHSYMQLLPDGQKTEVDGGSEDIYDSVYDNAISPHH